jgi:carboxypeptidase D
VTAVIGRDVVQSQIPAVNFVHKYEHVFAFKCVFQERAFGSLIRFLPANSQTFLAQLDEMAETCGYSDYMSQHLKYPPNGSFPFSGNSVDPDPSCEVWDAIYNAALTINPAFNIYRIFDMMSSR